MTTQELTALCTEWKYMLRLLDWRISVKIRRMRDMPEGMQGCVDITWSRKEAVVSIVDPVDYPPDSAWKQDMEQVLVHELLHLHFPEPEGNDLHMLYEQGVQMTALALVDLKRQGG